MSFDKFNSHEKIQSPSYQVLDSLKTLENSITICIKDCESKNINIDNKVNDCAKDIIKLEHMIEDFENNDISVLGTDSPAKLVSDVKAIRGKMKKLSDEIGSEAGKILLAPFQEARSTLKEYADVVSAKQNQYLIEELSIMKGEQFWGAKFIVSVDNKVNSMVDNSQYGFGELKKEPWNDVDLNSKVNPQLKPKLPKLARVGKTSRKVLIERTVVLCKNLREALVHHLQNLHPELQNTDNRKAIGQHYNLICNFENYLAEDIEIVKKTYLRQAPQLQEKLTDFYSSSFSVEQQALFNGYFKPLDKELSRLHSRLV